MEFFFDHILFLLEDIAYFVKKLKNKSEIFILTKLEKLFIYLFRLKKISRLLIKNANVKENIHF